MGWKGPLGVISPNLPAQAGFSEHITQGCGQMGLEYLQGRRATASLGSLFQAIPWELLSPPHSLIAHHTALLGFAWSLYTSQANIKSFFFLVTSDQFNSFDSFWGQENAKCGSDEEQKRTGTGFSAAVAPQISLSCNISKPYSCFLSNWGSLPCKHQPIFL